VENRNSVQMRL